MSRRRGFVGAALAVAWPAVLAAQGDGPETTAYHFLNLGSGPRIEALAGAGTAVAEGVDALNWNPALLSRLGAGQVSGTYFRWLDGVHSGYVGGCVPWGRAGVGLSVRTLAIPEFGNVVDEPRVGQSDFAVSAGLGRPILGLDAGVAGKVFRSRIAEESASGWAIDAGLNYRYVEGWNLSAALRNWGPSASYIEGVDEELPAEAALGLGATLGELHVDSEVVWERGPGSRGAVGLEYWFRNRLALRVGSRFGTESGDAVEPWAAGFGIRARRDLLVDYSFRDGTMEPSHRLGIRWNFGREGPGREEEDVLSPRKFYRVALDQALDQALVGFPGGIADTIEVRPITQHDAGPVIAELVVERLGAQGAKAAPKAFGSKMTDSTLALANASLSAAGKPLLVPLPELAIEIRESEYKILRSERARGIGPQSVDRQATVHVALELLSDDGESLWKSEGHGSALEETVNASRIPASPGYPQAAGTNTEAKPLHPLVEPAIVGGIVAGLAVIFFTNRTVGE
jgi:hypothetical protein